MSTLPLLLPPQIVASNEPESPHDFYLSHLPDRPYCTNTLGQRLLIRPKHKAVSYTMLQPNAPLVWKWMVFDLDCEDAYFRPEERGCPTPNYTAINPDNGHAHVAYLLESPISAFENSSRRALRYFEDVQRGLIHKLGADPNYVGLLTKNPLSPQWQTDWQAASPYTLDRLNDCLDKSDKRHCLKTESSGVGRNCAIFDFTRESAYRECLKFKKGDGYGAFLDYLMQQAGSFNSTFCPKLSYQEVNGIVRSIAKWTWEEFSEEKFSAIQSHRGRMAWRNKRATTLSSTKPWTVAGVSRATWYRLDKLSLIPPILLLS